LSLGDRITNFRTRAGISQEQLAEQLSVSRQSVSKWEMDHALPQVDKIIELCDLFGISTDSLLRESVDYRVNSEKTLGKNKYFGTDGYRGEANVTLTSANAYKVGRFLGWYFSNKLSGCSKAGYRPKIVVGKDTRLSSYMLEYSIVAGLTASGADAYMLHVTTTPSVSYVTRQDGFDCGIMITASHNPYYDNGIKVINRHGEKLDDEESALIEAYIDGIFEPLGITGDDLPLAQKDKIGRIVDYVSGRNRYLGYLISVASHSYKHLKIGLDCANGASWNLAKSLFSALGAQVTVIGDEPDGTNINEKCGSTHIEKLTALVREKHLDLGFAFDGDCDRCIAVDENGKVVDGDAMLYILGLRLKDRGMLNGDTVVATVMSNSGLFKSLEKIGIKCAQTKVGDRFVYECMQENDYTLGGEQSGHIILKKYATTGDGLLTAIMICEEVCSRKKKLSELSEPVMVYPQYTKNIKVSDKAKTLSDSNVLKAKEDVEKLIDGKGRVLLRESGTEPVIRIMIECEEGDKCQEYAEIIADKVKEGGYAV